MIWIGVDAHKRVHQSVALGESGVLARKAIRNTADGWAELLAWAARLPQVRQEEVGDTPSAGPEEHPDPVPRIGRRVRRTARAVA